MATYKTKSGLNKVVFFSNELAGALSAEAAQSQKSPSWLVRQALLEYLQGRGYEFSPLANPAGRGSAPTCNDSPKSKTPPAAR